MTLIQIFWPKVDCNKTVNVRDITFMHLEIKSLQSDFLGGEERLLAFFQGVQYSSHPSCSCGWHGAQNLPQVHQGGDYSYLDMLKEWESTEHHESSEITSERQKA
jgi:hypothetical protein